MKYIYEFLIRLKRTFYLLSITRRTIKINKKKKKVNKIKKTKIKGIKLKVITWSSRKIKNN